MDIIPVAARWTKEQSLKRRSLSRFLSRLLAPQARAGLRRRRTRDRAIVNQIESIPVLSPNFSVGTPSLSSIASSRLDIVVSGAFRM